MAPEIVLKTEFCGPPADIYASGVLLFAFLCGRFPFKGENDSELYKNIVTSELVMPEHLPCMVKSILICLLKRNADERPCSGDVLKYPWV